MSDTDFADVMAALRDGQRFQVGGGRIFRTYAMTNGQLVVIVSDDGYTEEHPCDEATLRAAMAEVPDGFRKIVEWWKAGAFSGSSGGGAARARGGPRVP